MNCSLQSRLSAPAVGPHRRRRRAITAHGFQEAMMGLAVAASVGALLVNGLRGPPEVCDMCGGNGGSKCFVCEGTGMKPGVALQDLVKSSEGRKNGGARGGNPRSCVACGGTGLILCRKCQGTGFMKPM